MNEKEIVYNTKAALTFMVREGGLRATMFVGSVRDDALIVIRSSMPDLPQSQYVVVDRAVEEWRADHIWLKDLPDKERTIATFEDADPA